MSVVRDDLIALSPAALAVLANVGLVKRAQREIGEGKGPSLAIAVDGTVIGSFADEQTGVTVVARLVPQKALRDCPCTCGAVSVCRHRVATALAYPAWASAHGAPAEEGAPVDWNPGDIDDATVAKFVGRRTFARARRAARSGLLVVLVPGTERDGTPTAKLPSCTVRFHVPNDLSYARCDCAAGAGCEHVVLAVLAFRRAAELGSRHAAGPIALGDRQPSATTTATTDRAGGAALDDAVALVMELARFGVSNASASFAERFARVRASLEAARLVWPLDAFEALERMVEAYGSRSARFDERRTVQLALEIVARQRAASSACALPAAFVLGEDQARETLLDHVRLIAVGARVEADGDARTVEVFLADADSGDVLVFEKAWAVAEAGGALRGAELAKRIALPDISLASLAHGQLVTRAARRGANGRVSFGKARASTSVTLQRGEWEDLPAPLLAHDFAALDEHLRALPPRVLRPRVLAEGFHVVKIASVADVAYLEAEQRVVVVVRDEAGTALRLERTHTSVTPFVVDAVAAAAESGLRYAAGPLRRTDRGLVLEPLALVRAALEDDDDRVVVPDLVTARSVHHPSSIVERRGATDDLHAELDRVELLVSEGMHMGLARLPTTYRARLHRSAERLANVGVEALARAARRLVEALGSDAAPNRFFDLAILLELARELR